MTSLAASIITLSKHVRVRITVCTIVTKTERVCWLIVSSRWRNSMQKVILKWRRRRILVRLELDQPDRFRRPCSVPVEGEKVKPFSERRLMFKVLHQCNVMGVVWRVASKKVLKAFSLEPCVVSTQEAVVVTRQVKLSTLVQAASRYDLPFLISQKLQTHTHGVRLLI